MLAYQSIGRLSAAWRDGLVHTGSPPARSAVRRRLTADGRTSGRGRDSASDTPRASRRAVSTPGRAPGSTVRGKLDRGHGPSPTRAMADHAAAQRRAEPGPGHARAREDRCDATRRPPRRPGPRRPSPGVSTASTASSAAIATASWSRSGSRVVSCCSFSPGHITARTQRAAAVAPGELDHLEGDAGDQRHAEDAREHQPVPGGQADRGEDEDRDDHHDQQEARAAARVQAREALRVLGRRAASRPRSRRSSCARRRGTRTRGAGRACARAAHVAEEDRGADDALDEPEQERGARAGP